MKRHNPWLAASGVALCIAALLAASSTPLTASEIPAAGFTIARTPSPNVQGNTFNAVSAISASDVWAVGFDASNNLNESRTLIEHFNGTRWSAVPSPNPGSPARCQNSNTGNVLNSVAAVSSTNVWAVGFAFTCSSLLKPMILHWNGTAWGNFPSPPLGTNDNAALNSITAISASDIYAVGFQPATNGAVLPLIEHFDGTAWSVVQNLPIVSPTQNVLSGITATSSSDVWVVGTSGMQSTLSNQTLVMHFDGSAWSIIPSPNALPPNFLQQNILQAVTAVSPTDVTAVGEFGTPGFFVASTLVEHWDGVQWSIVSSPSPSTFTELLGVAAISSSDVYAAGFFASSTSGQKQVLIEHFDGTSWSVTSTPTSGVAQQLNGIFALPTQRKVFAAGAFSTNGSDPETGLLIVPLTFLLLNSNG
jgi:hypothetical protein